MIDLRVFVVSDWNISLLSSATQTDNQHKNKMQKIDRLKAFSSKAKC